MIKLKNAIAVVFLCLFTMHTDGQSEGIKSWDALQGKRGREFVDEKGKSVGCDGNLECLVLGVIIYLARYDKSTRQFVLQGNVYDAVAKGADTLRIGWTSILLAEPCKDTLKTIRKIGETFTGGNKGAIFPNRRGDFDLRFTASPGDRLYFEHGLYGLLEYNIDKIVSGEVVL